MSLAAIALVIVNSLMARFGQARLRMEHVGEASPGPRGWSASPRTRCLAAGGCSRARGFPCSEPQAEMLWGLWL